MSSDYFKASYDILCDVYKNKAYNNVALKNAYVHPKKNTILKIVNGTLENHYFLLAILNQLSEKSPRLAIKILLMQSIFCIKILEMNESAVKKMALEIAQERGKKEVSDFIIFVLSQVKSESINVKQNSVKALEIEYNTPYWLIKALKNDYPKAYKKILKTSNYDKVHIRLISTADKKRFEQENPDHEKTLSGYYVKLDDKIKELLIKGEIFVQSLTSTFAVLSMGDVNEKNVLDVCSAPGGKAVYLAEKGAHVTACDIHPHRLDLIRAYAEKSKVELNIVAQDATLFNPMFENKFDCILVDAPCSGIGVLSKRKDIIFNRKESDIQELAKLQLSILNNSKAYLKEGGILIYSTCTMLKRENEEVIEQFLSKNNNFVLQTIADLPYNNNGMLQFLPDGKGMDGFFIARMSKSERTFTK